MTEETVPFLVPIVAIGGAFAVAVVAMILKAHTRERHHRERMFLAEKGMEIPRELYEIKEPKPNGFRASRAWLMVLGTLCVFIGIGVMIALGVREGMYEGINGVIPLLIGVGLLGAERMIARSVAKNGGN